MTGGMTAPATVQLSSHVRQCVCQPLCNSNIYCASVNSHEKACDRDASAPAQFAGTYYERIDTREPWQPSAQLSAPRQPAKSTHYRVTLIVILLSLIVDVTMQS